MIRFSVNHKATATRLRTSPGEWQHVGSYSTPNTACTVADLIRTGRNGSGVWYRPTGAFEARTRREAGGVVVEARFVGAVGSIGGRPGLRIARLFALLQRRHGARLFLDAREHTAAESERIAYALDARLILHPELLATDADYPDWTPGGGR